MRRSRSPIHRARILRHHPARSHGEWTTYRLFGHRRLPPSGGRKGRLFQPLSVTRASCGRHRNPGRRSRVATEHGHRQSPAGAGFRLDPRDSARTHPIPPGTWQPTRRSTVRLAGASSADRECGRTRGHASQSLWGRGVELSGRGRRHVRVGPTWAKGILALRLRHHLPSGSHSLKPAHPRVRLRMLAHVARTQDVRIRERLAIKRCVFLSPHRLGKFFPLRCTA